MSESLSLRAHVEEMKQKGLTGRLLTRWDGRLEEWLQAVLPPGVAERYDDILDDEAWEAYGPRDDETVDEWTERLRSGYWTWSFPSDALRLEYLGSVADRDDDDVRALLRLFLFEEAGFWRDSEGLYRALYVDRDPALSSYPVEFGRRLLAWSAGGVKPHPSIRWVLDLLPQSPGQAIDAITGYLNAYRGLRPEGRSQGPIDAISIIRARWIDDLAAGTEALFRLSPRELETIVAALYRKLGYSVQLTPMSRDGGRDVIARKASPGRSETIEIECKAHSAPVGVEIVRQLQGVVARSGANRGVLVAIGTFTRGAMKSAAGDQRLELIDGAAVIRLLNEAFGPLWFDDRSWICRGLG